MITLTYTENNEIWVDIKGFEGLYQISNLGRVKSVTRNLIRKIQVNKKHIYGYCEITLSKNNKDFRYKIHHLVAEHFIPNPYNKPQVNHIDGNKLNNTVSNLEWVTYEEYKKYEW